MCTDIKTMFLVLEEKASKYSYLYFVDRLGLGHSWQFHDSTIHNSLQFQLI